MLKAFAKRVISAYQKFVSPFLGSNCRFVPSCSQYASQALERYGIFRGSVKALMRILRCQPIHPGGYDPVLK